MRCAVFGCAADNQCKGLVAPTKFYRFPKDEIVIKSWIKACGRSDNINVKCARICSKHFKSEDFPRDLKKELLKGLGFKENIHKRELKDDAVPSLFLPYTDSKTFNKTEKITTVEETELMIKTESPLDSDEDNNKPKEEIFYVEIRNAFHDRGTNTEYDYRDDEIKQLRKKIEFLERQQAALLNIFSPIQIKKLLNPAKRCTWAVQDISKAIVIYSSSPRTYKLLLRKGFPFPAVSTVRAWLRKLKTSSAANNIVIKEEHEDLDNMALDDCN